MKFKYIILIGLTAFVVLTGLAIIAFFSNQTSMQKNSVISPTPIEKIGNIHISVTPTQILPYTKTNNDSTFGNEIDTKQPLQQSDIVAKQNTITILQQNGNSLFETDSFKIMYIQTYDMFQVEIKTTNIKQAEDDVLTWFTTKGLSKDAVCKIPVQFYLNFYIKHQINQEIPPLFYGC